MSPTHPHSHRPLADRATFTTPPAMRRALTCERIWFDPAPHIADRKTLDVDIDPVAPERYLVAAALGRLEPTPRVVVRLPGPADRCVVRSAQITRAPPTGSANGYAGTYAPGLRGFALQGSNRGVIGRPGRTLGC
jgi:hypothetical protein